MMKKLSQLMILCFLAAFMSCSDEETLNNDVDVAAQELELADDLSEYVDTSYGLYKGLFTTNDSGQRGVVEIQVINDNLAKAELDIVNGQTLNYTGIPARTANGGLMVQLITVNSSFEFVVDADGSNPTINRAVLNDVPSLIVSAKENTRGALTMNPGTWSGNGSSGSPISGTFSLMFDSQMDADGDSTLITTMMMFNMVDLGGSMGNVQENCADDGIEQMCDVSGVSDPDSGFAITWSGVHTSVLAVDCSIISGTWSGPGGASGSFVTDNLCDSAPGDFLQTAIPIMPSAEGTGCAMPGFSVALTDYTASGLNTDDCAAAVLGSADIFYTWTSTSDALFFNASSLDDIVVRDAAGIVIECAAGSTFGGTTLSGWTIGDDLIIQILSDNDPAEFCLEEATIPMIPANDLCMNALPIACGESDSGSTLLATDETGVSGNDVFYSFSNAGMVDQTVTVSLCNSSYDTRLRILDGCAGTEIIQNDDNSAACGPGGNSQLDFTAVAGESYIIVVEAFTTQSGAYEIAVTCEDIVPPPALLCGDTYIDDGGADGNYSNGQTISDTVTAGAGETITFDFSTFALENTWDHMRFFDGPDDTAPEITTSVGGATTTFTSTTRQGFTGGALAGDSVVSTGNTLTVVFQADGSFNDLGYEATVTCAAGFTDTGSQTTMSLEERQARPELSIERQLELKREVYAKAQR